MNNIELSVFVNRISSICDEMGAVLQRSSFSPNIKERLDFSCALFDADGELCAQAAHIPVHLGSMAYAMKGIVSRFCWEDGDMVVVNDPYEGGTHLPDVTFIAPVLDANNQVAAFVVNRAHHANIGATAPGSMPVSTHIDEEGLRLAPTKIMKQGKLVEAVVRQFIEATGDETLGDIHAQISANTLGVARVAGLLKDYGKQWSIGLRETNAYGRRMANVALSKIPKGTYAYIDYLDSDGISDEAVVISVKVEVAEECVSVDFTGSSSQVAGNINCPLPVAAAAVYYVFRCLMPEQTPACHGCFEAIKIVAEPGTIVNATYPAAVVAGNVETSMRIVDAVLGALAKSGLKTIPAASQGTMNNVAMGARGESSWDYYETIGGGIGAACGYHGADASHSHMTNTLNTPIECIEMSYPLRVTQYAIRKGSGGDGEFCGGNGMIREYQFLANAEVSLLTDRRRNAPWGLNGAKGGKVGENLVNGQPVKPKCSLHLKRTDLLTIKTPGGGGYGVA
jgi:N-methylhydantoinase B